MYPTISIIREKQQLTVVNRSSSELLPVSFGGSRVHFGADSFHPFRKRSSVLASVSSESVYMFADDTTVYYMSDTTEKSIAQLNTALRELNEWCLINRPTPHTSKSETMLISGRNPPVNITPIFVGNSTIECMGI